jgi:NAD-dependent dihydropyrimidine dehydrogenase PreA subunit
MNDIYLKDVVTLKLDTAKCIKCGICLNVCPRKVLDGERKSGISIVNKDRCIECGACARNCPVSAITVEPGVGCAYAIIRSRVFGGKPICGGCADKNSCC